MNPPPPDLPDVSLRGLEQKSEILVAPNHPHWELYPTDHPLSLAAIERTPDGIGLILTVATARPLERLEVTGTGRAETRVEDNSITVRFPDLTCTESQPHELQIVAISTNGERTAPHHIRLAFTSSARDAASGRTGHHRITVRESDLQLAYSRVSDWIIDTPDEADRAYAQKRWGGLIADCDNPYAKARAVTRAVIDDFEPRRGVPSDAMNRLHPFRQHERILAGLDHGWCANLAEVLCHALNSLDVPCRLVRMRHTYRNATSDVPGENFEVLLAGGHTVAEIFDATRQQWIWLDPSQRQLAARDAGGHLLNLAEIHHRVNLPHQARDLSLDHYDPATQTVTTHRFADSPVRANLLHYCKREQRFYYFRRRRNA